ncbi:MAG: gliding motility-associated C-terminal domain-containing protein, partial [Bacteroidota bacterium]
QLNASGGNAYSWLPSPTLSNVNIPNPIASPISSTIYYITVTNSSNCSSSDSIKVSVKQLPVFGISPDVSTCKGSTVQLNAAGGNIYSWQPSTGLDISNIAGPVASPLQTTLYTVNITEKTCGDAATLSTLVTVLPLPGVKAASSNNVDCTTPAAQLSASGASVYVWQPSAGLNDSIIAKPLSSPANSTLYTVKGTDVNGCSNYDTVSVLVTHSGDLLVNMPNAFSPNGDGRNDCFGISRYAGFLQRTEFSVYDRFGVRIFHTTNPLNCWDGRYKGKLQDAGGFVYVLKASTFCGEIFKKGIVMLVK